MSYAGLRQEKIVAETIRNWQARYEPSAMLRVTDIQLPCLERSLPCGILDVYPLLPRDMLDCVSKPGPHRIRRSTGSKGRARPKDEDSAAMGATPFAQHEAFQAPCAKKLAQQTHASGVFAKRLAQQANMQRNLGFLARWANSFAPGTATTRNLNVQGHDDALTLPT